jgi:orotidine-5'-phosphate decarboxylase
MASGQSRLDVPARERLIVALDVETGTAARRLVELLGDAVEFYKVGWELVLSGDYMTLVRALSEEYDKKVFADLKFHEIPMTVRRAMRQLRPYHVEFVTLHAQETAAISAAVEEKNGNGIKVLAVPVLTSLDQEDLRADGIRGTVEEVVLSRTARALKAGCDGVISSGLEVPAIREQFGDGLVVVVPGIRGEKSDPDDQKRTVAVEQAFANGADYIVVGREIRDAPDPRAAALQIQERIAAAFDRGRPA